MMKIFLRHKLMLKYLNEKYINSSKKIKIELFILPILLVIFYFVIFEENQKDENIDNSKIFDFENRKMSESSLDIFEKIENSSKNNKTELLENKNFENRFSIKISSNLKNIVDFMQDLENLNEFSSIKRVHLKKENDKYLSNIEISFDKFHIKKQEEFINNLLDEKEEDIIETVENIDEDLEDKTDIDVEDNLENSANIKDFKLNAVIGKNAFINGKWLKIGDFLDKYKLTKIDKNFVILEKDNNKIKVEFSYAKSIKTKN